LGFELPRVVVDLSDGSGRRLPLETLPSSGGRIRSLDAPAWQLPGLSASGQVVVGVRAEGASGFYIGGPETPFVPIGEPVHDAVSSRIESVGGGWLLLASDWGAVSEWTEPRAPGAIDGSVLQVIPPSGRTVVIRDVSLDLDIDPTETCAAIRMERDGDGPEDLVVVDPSTGRTKRLRGLTRFAWAR